MDEYRERRSVVGLRRDAQRCTRTPTSGYAAARSGGSSWIAVWKQLLARLRGDSMLSLARTDRAWAEGMCVENLLKHSLRKSSLI